jgi:uncharacterized surface protein with fasciclin (FAS1) repeats
MKRVALFALAALASAAVVVPAASGSHASNSSAAAGNNTIVDVASGDPQFCIKQAGLVNALSDKSKLTVFAPTNAAFAKLPKATLQEVQSDKKLLTSILTYHVIDRVLIP